MNKMISTALAAGLIAGAGAISAVQAQVNPDEVEIRTEQVADGLYVLFGSGGNIGVSAGEDGVIMIDDQFAPLTGKILAAIEAISDQPVKFVINTHWHGDHTGGNENLGERGAVIVAHRNVRARMSTEQFNEFFDRTTPPSPEGALPNVTFTDQMTFHMNGHEAEVMHISHAHTDGDSLIWFAGANAVHMGDTFFKDRFPYIDVAAGGNINGIIEAANRVLERAGADTTIIPGHGTIATPADLERYRDKLIEMRDGIQALIDQGLSEDEVVAQSPAHADAGTWGSGFMNAEAFSRLVYHSLTRD